MPLSRSLPRAHLQCGGNSRGQLLQRNLSVAVQPQVPQRGQAVQHRCEHGPEERWSWLSHEDKLLN